MRFILVCIVVIGYLILSIPILLVEWIIGRFSPEKKDISSLRIIQAVFRFILKITGAKITVIGEENVPKDTTCTLYRQPQKLLRHTSYIAVPFIKCSLARTHVGVLYGLPWHHSEIKRGHNTSRRAVQNNTRIGCEHHQWPIRVSPFPPAFLH